MRLKTLGSDPELFVVDKKTGEITSAIGKLGGSKGNPLSLGYGRGLQEDNVLAEFNTHPVGSYDMFANEIQSALKAVRRVCSKQGLGVKIQASHEYTAEALNKYGPAALEFGCDPDTNAYTGMDNPTPDSSGCLRSAGGHLHIGYSGLINDEVSRMIIRSCDLFLGVPSVLMDPDTRRRNLYGKAGAYRPKSYGVEYRSLSNFWLSSRARTIWAFKQAKRATDKAGAIDLMLYKDQPLVVDCINNSDKDLAQHLVNKYNLEVV